MAECHRLVALAETRDRQLMVGQSQRYFPGYKELKQRIDTGSLGQIHHARTDAIYNLREYAEPHTGSTSAIRQEEGVLSMSALTRSTCSGISSVTR